MDDYAPLSRPLFIYVSNESIKDNEKCMNFVKFALENAGDIC